MKIKSFQFVLLILGIFTINTPIYANQVETANSAYKTPEIKTDFENRIVRFAELMNEIPTSFIYVNSSKALVTNCRDYSQSNNLRNYPIWANNSAVKMCAWGQTMDALLSKNKKPIGNSHCRNLAEAIKIIEDNATKPEYIEISPSFNRLLAAMKKAYNARSTHSWNGGWYGANSYDYRCN